MLGDDEIADVLTFVRNAFGNKAAPVTRDSVSKARAATKDRETFYQASELTPL
jgi:hypothetical protein